jgi:hypothetical protein
VLHVSVEHLRTSWAALRSSALRQRDACSGLAELPLRVVPREDGSFEVVDGFKRLARWAGSRASAVPVIVEQAGSPLESKALLLRANAPPRTLGAMDEARVVDSLVRDDGLTPAAVARLLGRRKAWVARRHALATRLARGARDQLDEGRIGATLAHALSALRAEDQEGLLACARRHRLAQRESLALVAALRATDSEGQRRELLRDPLPTLRPQPHGHSTTGSLATRIEERLERMRQALVELSAFELPSTGLTDAERRRLEAQYRALLDLLANSARALLPLTTASPMEAAHDSRPDNASRPRPDMRHAQPTHHEPADPDGDAAERGCAERTGGASPASRPSPPAGLRDARDRPPGASRPQDRAPDLARTGSRPRTPPGCDEPGDEQARRLPRGDRATRAGAPDDHPHPARDPRAGLHGWPHDPGRPRALPPGLAGSPGQGQAAVRDATR